MIQVCVKCNSDKLIEDAVLDNSGQSIFTVAVDEKPEAAFFRQRIRSGVYALVCGNCRYIEFYAQNPTLLYMAYQNKLNNSR